MRKYVLTSYLIISFLPGTFSQTGGTEKSIRWQIDSLKNILPTLRDSARVDCLNSLVFLYDILPVGYSVVVDTACSYANEAFIEAKRIGYKTGLGYAYLRMGICNYMAGVAYWDKHRKDNQALYDSAVLAIKRAILIGKELEDDIMLGSAYRQIAWFEWERDNTNDLEEYIDYSKKAIFHFEKGVQRQQRTYKELQYVECDGCEGNESWLGSIHMVLAREYIYTVRDKVLATHHLNKAIDYYLKAGEKSELIKLYNYLFQINWVTFNYELATDASLKAISTSREIGDEEGEIIAVNNLSLIYFFTGDFEKGLENGKRGILLAEKLSRSMPSNLGNRFNWGQTFFWMGAFYQFAGDYETAMIIKRKGRDYYPNPPDRLSRQIWNTGIGELHRLTGNYDSAMHYLAPFAGDTVIWSGGKACLASLYADLKQYDKALPLITESIEMEKKRGILTVPIPANLTIKANIYLAKKEYKKALQFAREGFDVLKVMKGKVIMIDNYKVLSEIFQKMGINDSAYFYLKQYTMLKDSLYNRQLYFHLNNYKKEAEELRKTSQINLLNKDNQLKEQKLKQQAFVRNSLIAGILLLFLLGVVIFRNLLLKRKNEKLRLQKDMEMQQLASEKKHAELQQQALELEMQALRAQINPHFIFNCLSSINRFIFKNDNKLASDYLTRFSRLIRMVLMHSQKKLIPLEDELEMLRLYLDLERLRFKDAFDYSITTTNIVDAGAIFIPPLLLQPFCENAVWHGLMHKESKGRLNIIISDVTSEDENVLHCVIEDDGIGREKAAEFKSKSAESEKSMGLKITTERLALLNEENNFSTFYKIEDVFNENNVVTGTRVQLKIKYKETIEEFA